MHKPLHFLVCAVEPSGDALGASLVRNLRAQAPAGSQFFGCGGAQMAEAGLASAFEITPFSVMGIGGALKALFAARKAARDLAALAQERKADAAVLIDGWGFSKLVAERLRRECPNLKIYKYVAPQIWASRPHRIKDVGRLFDGVLTLYPFEAVHLLPAQIPIACTGHPVLKTLAQEVADISPETMADFRHANDLKTGPVLCVLLGSRRAEVRKLAPIFGASISALRAQIPDLQIIVPIADAVADEVRGACKAWALAPKFVAQHDRLLAYRVSDAALAASGTVTSELAVAGTPTVVAYKVAPLTAFVIRRIAITKYASLVNIAAGSAVLPEFLQQDCAPELIVPALAQLFDDARARATQHDAASAALKKLGLHQRNMAEPAHTVLNWLAEQSPNSGRARSKTGA